MITGTAAIVTLGACASILWDKAGTLHRMTVQSFWLNGSFEMLCGAVIDRATQHPAPRRQRSHRFRRVLRSRERDRESERERERERDRPGLPQRVSKSMRRLARRAGPEQRRPGPGRLLATLRRPRCSDVVTRYIRRGTCPRHYDVPFNSTNRHALCVVHPPSNEAPVAL